MKFEQLSATAYSQLVGDPDTVVIHFGAPGQPKVLLKKNHTILKFFYPKKKRFFTSTRFRPPALRFYHHSQTLVKRGYLAPAINRIQYCRDLGIYLLQYPKITGENIRAVVKQGEFSLLNQVARLIATMHYDGIFFRAIHLENILYTDDKKFALIDVSDMKFKSRPLSLYRRYRNLKHLFNVERDQDIWQQFGKDTFLAIYLQHTKLSPISQYWLRFCLRKIIEN